jgi:menaquinol-cytochrome c reductase iron-sulfur subunit
MAKHVPPDSSTMKAAVQPRRRSFFAEASAVLIGGLVTIFPFATGLLPIMDPLRRSAVKAKDIRIAPLDAVPDDGIPRRFPVIADLVDAWTTSPGQPIGSVYLRRAKGSETVEALNAICPHAGCSVQFEAKKDLFVCPCHTSAFDVDGKRRLDVSRVPPRDMDNLVCHVRDGEVWVEFENFLTGKEHKIPRG